MTKSLNKNNHVLIIAYHILPYTKLWGASQRVHYLAEHLTENNYNVTVVGANFGVLNFSGKTLNYKSVSVKIKPKFIQKYQESFQKTIETSEFQDTQSHVWSFSRDIKICLKSAYLYIENFFFNDFAHYGFLSFLWEKQAKRIILQQISLNNTKTVIISGPYFGVFKLAKIIKKKNKDIKLILDYRDPWNLLKKGSKVTLLKEKKYLSLADKIVMFSDMFKNDMMKFFSLPEDKCVTVYNGFDGDLWDEIDSNLTYSKNDDLDKRFIISYVSSNISFKKGTPRDPRTLIKAVTMMENTRSITLNIVGCIDYPGDNEFNESPFRLNLLPFVQHKEALKIMYKSNVVVILSTEKKTSKYTLTGKLFDCIRSGNFILGVANSDRVNYRKLIEELKIGEGCNNEVEEIFKILDNQYKIWEQGGRNYTSNFNKNIYSRRNQNMKYIAIINNFYNSQFYNKRAAAKISNNQLL